MSLFAVKFQSQNPSKASSVSGSSIWQKFSILESQSAEYQSMGFEIMTEAEVLQASQNGNKIAPTLAYLNKTIRERREFAESLIEELKKENMLGGINVMQALWVQHKLRALTVTYNGVEFTIDLLNLVISGDIEVATIALMNCEVDDMTQPYHWFSNEFRNNVVTKLKAYLGWP